MDSYLFNMLQWITVILLVDILTFIKSDQGELVQASGLNVSMLTLYVPWPWFGINHFFKGLWFLFLGNHI